MADEQMIARLERRREALKADIAEEIARPFPDDLKVRRMKLTKCRLKDEIARLQRAPAREASAA